MTIKTILIGILLIVVGVSGFMLSGTADGYYAPTALIPAIMGLLMIFLGVAAINPQRRMMAMHIAVLIGLLSCAMSLVMLVKSTFGGTLNGIKAYSFISTAILTGLFVVLCVRSFIAARKARKAAAL